MMDGESEGKPMTSRHGMVCGFILIVTLLGCGHRETGSMLQTSPHPADSLPATTGTADDTPPPRPNDDAPRPAVDHPPGESAAKNQVKPASSRSSMPPTAGKRTPLNKQGTLFLEVLPNEQRRVVVLANVCLREGPLELLLCRKQTKEHEAILHADVNAKDIHAALEVCRAKPGSPVKYVEDEKGYYKIIPPHGTTIRVWLEVEREPSKWETINSRQWIRNARTGKELDTDWVFAGSALWTDPDDPEKKVHYLANNGNIISVSNFNDAMLDLPLVSSQANAELIFECWTERIPPLGTRVFVVLEPVLEEPKR